MRSWIRRFHEEEGAVLITVALSALVLFGLVAIGVDGSRGYHERRRAQNAADEAAIAGAMARCYGGGVVPAALASADTNGFDNNGTDNTVTVVNPYDGDADLVEVTITSVFDTSFGGVIGFDDITVRTRAVASCDPEGEGLGVSIYVAGEVCGTSALDIQGSNIFIDQGLHTNAGLHLNSGAGAFVIHGSVTHVGGETGNAIPPQTAQSGWQDWPTIWQIEDYAPGGKFAPGGAQAVAPGHYHYFPGDINNADVGVPMGMGGTMQPGLYFVEGSVDLQRVDGNVTIVSRGSQTYRGTLDLTHYMPDLVMFSDAPGTPTCGYDAIRFDAADGVWRGIIYAPNGQVSMSTSSASTHYGAIFAYEVDVSASGFSLFYDPAVDVNRTAVIQIEE